MYGKLIIVFILITIIIFPIKTHAQSGVFQPTSPYYATFYYQWYTTPVSDSSWGYWADHGNSPPNTWFSKYLPDPRPAEFNPSAELYSSNDYTNFRWQVGKMKEARLEVAIASWFGSQTREDTSFRNIITSFMGRTDNPYPNLRWALYYEDEGFADPSVSTLVTDLNYIKNSYASSPYFLKVNGKPVIFVYAGANDTPGTMPSRWKDANLQSGNFFYIVLKVFSGYAIDPNQPDSWHQYAPAARSGTYAPYSAFVSPGFYLDDGVSAERLSRNPVEFENAVKAMVSSSVDWKLVETWNEWGEGTSVEPGDAVKFNPQSGRDELDPAGYAFKNLYIDILNRNLPPLEGGLVITSTPTPTPPVTGGVDPIVVAAGDMVADLKVSPRSKHTEVSDLIIAQNADAVLAIGDVQYEYGQWANFMQYYEPTWGRFKNITFPAVGNHEYLDSIGSTQLANPDCDVMIQNDPRSYACGYFDYYNGKGNLTGRAGERGKGYYAFNIGNWRLYALNSNCSGAGRPGCNENSVQYQWFKNDLTANPKYCSMVFMHHPYLTSDERDHLASTPNSYDSENLEPLLQLFYNAGGDVYLAGHTHLYERYSPYKPGQVVTVPLYPFNGTRSGNVSDPISDDIYGIRQFIVGTGGKNVYAPDNMTPYDQYPDPDGDKLETMSVVHSNDTNTFGILKMKLRSEGYDWQFISTATSTQFTDSGTSFCHVAPNGPTVTPTPTVSACNLKSSGDADCNGTVNLVDFEIFRKEYSGTQNTKEADFDKDNSVSIIDFEIWRKGYFPV